MFAAIPEYNEAWEDYELFIAEHIDHAEQILANHQPRKAQHEPLRRLRGQ